MRKDLGISHCLLIQLSALQQDSVRTSHGTFLERYQDAIVTSIGERMLSYTFATPLIVIRPPMYKSCAGAWGQEAILASACSPSHFSKHMPIYTL